MTAAQSPVQASTFEMYRALVGVGIGCALLIATVFQITKPVIEHNRAVALQDAVFTVIPHARSSATFRRTEGSSFELVEEENPRGPLVYAGYDDGGRLLGVALTAQGMGYADVITVLYGYSFEGDAIVGMQVMESKETPGLGDKIEKDEGFLTNFEALDVSLDEAEASIAHPIEAVKNGEKTEPWQIDGITGATISSVAIANMLRVSTKAWIPTLRRRRHDFVKPQGGGDE